MTWVTSPECGQEATPREPFRGEVFLLPDDSAALARLDAYEEFHPDNPQASLFRRRRATVTLSNGKPELCWVYLYNRPVKITAIRDAR